MSANLKNPQRNPLATCRMGFQIGRVANTKKGRDSQATVPDGDTPGKSQSQAAFQAGDLGQIVFRRAALGKLQYKFSILPLH